MRITNTKTMTGSASNVPVRELREFLEGLSDSDTVSFRTTDGNRFESPTVTLTVTMPQNTSKPSGDSSGPSEGMGYISDSYTPSPFGSKHSGSNYEQSGYYDGIPREQSR